MPRYRLNIEYDGSSYCGWQKQAAQSSVQEALENAVFAFTQEKITLHGAGRTDSGVHALGQVAHFELLRYWPDYKVFNALNAHLRLRGEHISVTHVCIVSENFHARFSAIKRHYIYRILNRRAPPALDTQRVWWVSQNLNEKVMHEAAQLLCGQHDFTTFRCVSCQAKTPLRTLDELYVIRQSDFIEIHTSARSFLHKQVRSMVGCLKKVGENSWTPSSLLEALHARNRSACAPIAPACGLFLSQVDYPDVPFFPE